MATKTKSGAKFNAPAADIYDNRPWFACHRYDEPAGPRVVEVCREIARKQSTLMTNTEMCMGVFEYGCTAQYLAPGESFAIDSSTLRTNKARNVVETVFSKVVKPRISPMPLTNGGGYLQRHRAKQLGKAIEGVIEDNDGEQLEEDAVLDSMTTDHGAGAVMVYEDGEEVRIEHIPVEDVWFDAAEVRNKKPRNCYRVPKGGIDKYQALELYGSPLKEGDDGAGLVGTVESRRRAILDAATKPESWRSSLEGDAARVDIFESWHLPSGKVEEGKPHDGRHVIAVSGQDGTLVDEPWEGPAFPILLYTPRRRRRTIWGLSLMRDLLSPQQEHEYVTETIQRAHHNTGTAGWISPKSAEFNITEVEAGKYGSGWIAEYDGPQPPQFVQIDPVPQGLYGYREGIGRAMSEDVGVSTLASASQLPAGLQQASGKALQVFEDFEDVRLLPYHRERERFKMALSWLIIYAAKRLVDRGVKYQARYRGKHGIEAIDWSEVLMDAKDFVLRVFPVSQLSKQPAAKFAQLTELLNAQAITVEQFKRLYELPDLEAENELDTADTDIIDRTLDMIVVQGKYLSPEPNDNLQLAIQRASKFYNLCRLQEVPEARLQMLLDYVEDAKALLNPPAPPVLGTEAPMDPMAGGDPSMPPDPGMMPPPDPGAPPMPPGEMPQMAA